VFYEDRISVATPEGVTLEATLAGVGSRFAAGIIDQLLRWALLLALLALLLVIEGATGGNDFSGLAMAAVIVTVFLVQFGYDVLFETMAAGRTPGKRWTGLRVVKLGGTPVTFLPSALRNILRIVDALPGIYLVGILFVMFTRNNQRLGDLAAGTIVVRERRQTTKLTTSVLGPAPAPADTALYDISAVSAEELATIRRFLDRRSALTPEARQRLAREMASRLMPKVVGPPRQWESEEFLEYVLAAKAARG
jgi:uncharacterized RDD family membrane protein YckC